MANETVNNLYIGVVSCAKRNALITKYLDQKGLVYNLSITPDYELPNKPYPKSAGLVQRHRLVYAYRCYRGHQKAMSERTTDDAIIFEDDAVPIVKDWDIICGKCHKAMKEFDFDIISLHSRQYDIKNLKCFEYDELKIYELKGNWAVALLAYVVRKEICDKIINTEFEGIPADIYFQNNFRYGILDPTPFSHNNNQKSIIDGI